MKKNFKELAEETRVKLRKRGQYGSSSDLYVNEEVGVAVIGIQTSENGVGRDSIYVLKKNDGLERVLSQNFQCGGRMFPTEILDDGTGFRYTSKYGDGEIHEKVYDFQKATFYIEKVINSQPRLFFGI